MSNSSLPIWHNHYSFSLSTSQHSPSTCNTGLIELTGGNTGLPSGLWCSAPSSSLSPTVTAILRPLQSVKWLMYNFVLANKALSWTRTRKPFLSCLWKHSIYRGWNTLVWYWERDHHSLSLWPNMTIIDFLGNLTEAQILEKSPECT